MNKKTLTLGSLFDGSGGFPLGGLLSGIHPVWASEIEPFPIRVTTKRLPFMKHYGDVSKLNGADIEPVDIITFGSPCQDMSIAGKRSGLDGDRSSLFYQAIRIVKEMRCATNGKQPRYIVWENVPGAFSSNKGADFKSVLEEVCRIKDETLSIPQPDKWASAGEIVGNDYSVAWRVLDAQYWGVPQRRKRIFLVADFAGGGAGQILFESEGVSGYSAEGFRTWQRTACRAENGSCAAVGFDGYNSAITDEKSATLGVNCGMSTGRNGVVLNDQGGNRMDVTDDVTCTLRAEAHHPPCVMESAGFCTEHSAKARNIGYEEEKSPTLRAGVVPAAIAIENHPADSRIGLSEDDTVQTLTSRMGTGGGNVPLLLKIRSGCEGGGKGPLVQEDKSATLGCNNDQTLFEPCSWDGGQVSPTLTKQNAGGNQRMPDKDNFNCVVEPFRKEGHPQTAGQGQGWQKASVNDTLNTFDCGETRTPTVVVEAYGISSKDSNAMKSDNPHSGIYKADTSRTIDANGGNPACNQGGIVVIEGNGSRPSHHGDGYSESDIMYTLNTLERHAVFAMTTGSFANTGEDVAPALLARDYKDPTVIGEPAYGIGRDTFNQGQNAQFSPSIEEELQPTLVAKGPGAVCKPVSFYPQMKAECQTPREDVANTLVNGTNPGYQNGLVENQYTVRRLTPVECARLQGFPDAWCSDLGTAEPTDEDIAFWADVFETHRKIMDTSTKPKTEKQIRSWLQDPYSDAAEYKMWGNGVALPCVFFVLSGIVYYDTISEV